MQKSAFYHPVWNRLFPNKWVLGLFLVLLFGIPRFILVLDSYVSGQSQWVSIVFTLICFTPLLFLKKAGRRESGSILGAILTHAGFNFAMGFLIFYAL